VTARVASINRSDGGVPKRPVPEGEIRVTGLEGDRQRDLRYHGGPDRAICLYSADVIAALRAEGHSLEAGSIGENLTVAGLDWAAVVPGVRLRVGASELEVTSYASPCANIAGWFEEGDIARVSQKRHPGWSRVYARVLSPGRVAVGDPVVLVPLPAIAERPVPTPS
jgi:MOSC domain-containing protein YiiM